MRRPGDEPGPELETGTRVEVRSRFEQSWSRGFEIAGVAPDGYLIRRVSDGSTLPLAFPGDDVRKERRRGTWWY